MMAVRLRRASEEPAVGIVVEDAGEEPLEVEAVDQFAGG